MALNLSCGFDPTFVESTTSTDEGIKDAELIKQLKKRRNKRISVSKTVNNIIGDLDSFSIAEARGRIARLKVIQEELNSIDGALMDTCISENASISTIDRLTKDNDVYLEKLSGAIAEIEYRLQSLECTERLSHEIVNHRQGSDDNIITSQARLPQLSLPTFAGDRTQFVDFISGFESAFNGRGVSSFDKFLYLKGQLKEAPRKLLDNLTYRENNYETAKRLLEQAYCNITDQKFCIIEKLIKLKFKSQSNDFEWFSVANNVFKQFTEFKVEIRDFFQYFFWNSLPDEMHTLYVNLLGKAKPSADEILHNFMTINQMYREKREKTRDFSDRTYQLSHRERERVQSTAIGIDMGKTSKMCKLCKPFLKEGQKIEFHSISRCQEYATAKEKINRLKELKYCILCSADSHLSKQCRTTLNEKCRFCGMNHLHILCLKSKIENETKTTKNKERDKTGETVGISSGLIWSDVLHASVSSGVLLPMVEFRSSNADDDKTLLCLLDSGSQGSFISEGGLLNVEHEISRPRVELAISGINSRRVYNTKEVVFKLKLGKTKIDIKALVIPNISTQVTHSNLKCIFQCFKARGYSMACHNLRKKNSTVDMIIGMDYMNIINYRPILFGKDPQSIFWQTEFGVILCGDIKGIIKNLKYLAPSPPSEEESIQKENYTSNINIDGAYKKEMDSLSISNIFGRDGEIDEVLLDEEVLREAYGKFPLDYVTIDSQEKDDDITRENEDLVMHLLNNIKTDPVTRKFVVPLLWNSKTSHLLANNYGIAYKILKNNIKRLRKDPGKLRMYDDVFKEQLKKGVIEKIDNVDQFLQENDSRTISFLGHMAVFREKASSPCRIVYLSNISQNGLSHNDCLKAGINLNEPILKVMNSLRFGRFLTICDIKKAFLNLQIDVRDQNRLLTLWYDDVVEECKKLVIYRSKTIIFGLPCSPLALMSALFKYLVYEAEDDDDDVRELKREMYYYAYMDNLAFTSISKEQNMDRYRKAIEIFRSRGLELQQFASNDLELQRVINQDENWIDKRTKDTNIVPLLGMVWNTELDMIGIKPVQFDLKANTKRKILAEINSAWDILGIYLPMVNRAKLLLHQLMCDKSIEWDTKLGGNYLGEWDRLCKVINRITPIRIPRFSGQFNERYSLIAFSDASRSFVGVVCYIKNLCTNKISFLCAKNKLVNKDLERKSTAILEAIGLEMGTKLLIDLYRQYTTGICGVEIEKLILFTDSTICISWLRLLTYKFDDLRKKSVILRNRLNNVSALCKIHRIQFCHVSGNINTADCVTRCFSPKVLKRYRFYEGPAFLSENDFVSMDTMVEVPNSALDTVQLNLATTLLTDSCHDSLFPLDRYHSFHRAVSVMKTIYKARRKFLSLIGKAENSGYKEVDYYVKSCFYIIGEAQKKSFSPIFKYFKSNIKTRKDIPPLVAQMNLFLDSNNILRVKSKLGKLSARMDEKYPILLDSSCPVAESLINDTHKYTNHGGLFSMMGHLRRKFWILRYGSTIKKVLKKCIICAKLNARPIKLTQNDFREFRVEPKFVPFSYASVDYIGPYLVNMGTEKTKVYLCMFTCLYTRGVNVIICQNMSTDGFLKALQCHSYSYGYPQFLLSDMGSNLTGARGILKNFFDDPEVVEYLGEHSISNLEHQVVPSKASFLNSVSETLVKQIKHLIQKSNNNRILDYGDFQFFINNVQYLVNSRPIAFRDEIQADIDAWIITPFLLINGHEPMVLNTVPELQDHRSSLDEIDEILGVDWVDRKKLYKVSINKLLKTKRKLNEVYYKEFLTNLEKNATNSKGRYLPCTNNVLSKGDLVTIIMPQTKRAKFPVAIVEDTIVNSLGETTGAYVRKTNRERVFHHVSGLIPIMRNESGGRTSDGVRNINYSESPEMAIIKNSNRPRRRAAVNARDKISHMLN